MPLFADQGSRSSTSGPPGIFDQIKTLFHRVTSCASPQERQWRFACELNFGIPEPLSRSSRCPESPNRLRKDPRHASQSVRFVHIQSILVLTPTLERPGRDYNVIQFFG